MKLVFNLTPEVLSPQMLLDCDVFNNGCLGGTPTQALSVAGIQSEANYPYMGELGRCRFNRSKEVMHYTNHTGVWYTDLNEGEEGLQMLALKGPLVALIDARSDSFKNYKSGVYFNPDCSQDKDDLNHAVLLVGYGTDPKEGDYWLVVSVHPECRVSD